jgi:type IV pilus assembly protein PilB
MAQRKLGQILIDLGYINDDQLWDILEEQKQSPGQPIGQVAVRMGLVNQRQVTEGAGGTVGHAAGQSGRDDNPAECA